MDSAVPAIAEWMPAQRWYGGKGHTPRLRRIGEWELPSAESGARVWSMLLMDDATDPPVLYQVPVVEREAAVPKASAHLIATLDDGTDGWGECVAMSEPVYSSEFVDSAELVIADHLLPRLRAVGFSPSAVASSWICSGVARGSTLRLRWRGGPPLVSPIA